MQWRKIKNIILLILLGLNLALALLIGGPALSDSYRQVQAKRDAIAFLEKKGIWLDESQLPAFTENEKARFAEAQRRWDAGERPGDSILNVTENIRVSLVRLPAEQYDGHSWFLFMPYEELTDGELLQIADAFGLVDSPMLIQMICDGKDVSVLEFCSRTGGNMKYLLIKRACGFDVIKAVIDLTLGEKPHVELSAPEAKYIVNDFIYCQPGVFDRLDGFDKLMEEGVLTDYKLLRPRGMQVRGVTSSSDRIAGFTVIADTLEEFNEKHRRVVAETRVLDENGVDIMRHDLLPDLK